MKYKISSGSASCAEVSSGERRSLRSPGEPDQPVAVDGRSSCSGVCFAEVPNQSVGKDTNIPVFFGRGGKVDDVVSGVSGVFFP